MNYLLDHMNAFFYMGGYGSFVWPCYGAMLAIFFINLLLPLRRFRRIKAKLRGKGEL